MKEFIILDIGKIVIVRNGLNKKYYKEVNGNLCDLDNEEEEYVNNIFKSDDSSIYYSEKLTYLINDNNDIQDKEKTTKLLEYIEKIIPENYKDNFYNNVKSVSVNINGDSKFESNNIKNAGGEYNVIENTVNISSEIKKMLYDVALETNEPVAFFERHLYRILLHELFHMASSCYDSDTKTVLCGFDKISDTTYSERNRGLTEGMTDVLAFSGLPEPTGTVTDSDYFLEGLIVNQLTQIVGAEVMLESYFGNKGTKEIEKKLNKIIDDFELSSSLFRMIEDNFNARNLDCKQSILSTIQYITNIYFDNKIVKAINDNIMSGEEAIKAIDIFEYTLITPEKIKIMKKNPDNYEELEDSVEQFYMTKNRIVEFINNEKIEKRL